MLRERVNEKKFFWIHQQNIKDQNFEQQKIESQDIEK